MTAFPTPRSHAEVCALPGPERLPYIEQVRVVYPRWQEIAAEIQRCHAMNTTAAEPQCLLLVGPTGAGKTTLTDSYARQFAPTVTETGLIMPVLKATIPSPATVKNLVIALLAALGDPRASSGTIGGMTERLKKFIGECGVELLILDELQHFVDQESQKVLLTVSNWLKTLIKETKVACVLVGLEGEAEQVVDANPQLARLFGDPRSLAPFRWDETLPATTTEFRTFLMQLERLLPLREPSHLSDSQRAWRCFVASQGVVSYVMALVRRAAYLALTREREHIDDALLAEAFAQRLAGTRRGIPNPFLGEPPPSATPKPPVPAKGQGGRRSTARRPASETITDVV